MSNTTAALAERVPPTVSPTTAAQRHQLDTELEAIFFLSRDPLSLERLSQILGQGISVLTKSVKRLQKRYSSRGIMLTHTPQGVTFVTHPSTRPLLTTYAEEARELSEEATETLAIIAYMQPITASAIAERRGSDPTHSLQTLLEGGLVTVASNETQVEEYRTTEHFLEAVGIASLDDLPLIGAEENPQVEDFEHI